MRAAWTRLLRIVGIRDVRGLYSEAFEDFLVGSAKCIFPVSQEDESLVQRICGQMAVEKVCQVRIVCPLVSEDRLIQLAIVDQVCQQVV